MKLNNTFAIGCLIQWYEIELVGEYLQSVKNSLDVIDNKENVVIDLYFNCDQSLEKLDKNQTDITKIKNKYNSLLKSIFDYDEDYPYGNYNSNVIEKISEYNFKAGLTTEVGDAILNHENAFKLKRYDTNDFPQ